jgi:hypothetical protein
MPETGFEPTILASEWEKTVQALDRAAIVMKEYTELVGVAVTQYLRSSLFEIRYQTHNSHGKVQKTTYKTTREFSICHSPTTTNLQLD